MVGNVFDYASRIERKNPVGLIDAWKRAFPVADPSQHVLFFKTLNAENEPESVSVVSAACDAEEAGEIAAALAKLGATNLIVTGLDLARRKGALVALACSGLKLSQVTASPYLAEGLETLTPLSLSRALLADEASRVVQKVA